MAQVPNKYYFATTGVVDWQHPAVFAVAHSLSKNSVTAEGLAQVCQQWVMDNILDSSAINSAVVSCSASDALIMEQGNSFSRSHLLAALLRANGLASSFCYQRKRDSEGVLELNGYCTVWLPESGWYPLNLAEPVKEPIDYHAGERHYRIYSHQPLAEVVRVLKSASNWSDARVKLPSNISMG